MFCAHLQFIIDIFPAEDGMGRVHERQSLERSLICSPVSRARWPEQQTAAPHKMAIYHKRIKRFHGGDATVMPEVVIVELKMREKMILIRAGGREKHTKLE